MKTISVAVPQNKYEVKIGNNIIKSCLLSLFQNLSEKTSFIITNETIHTLFPNYIEQSLPKEIQSYSLILPDGEQHKSLKTIETIYNFLIEHKANRKTPLIAFGGGVIGDMAGFAAATYMRGMPLIQIPTTLLSQVDSSIGGKTGVNHPMSKNCIGAFKQPLTTIIDIAFLKKLPQREFIAGYAELLKHGLIRDIHLFETLSQSSIKTLKSNESLLIDMIFSSCSVKARVVEEDEKESGLRAILNFGHTIGHFLETITNYHIYLHGEAVIVGMDFAIWWSVQKKVLTLEEYQRIHQHLKKLHVTINLPSVSKDQFLTILSSDKKNVASGIRFIGLTSIGTCKIFDSISIEELWTFFQTYLQENESLLIQTNQA